MKTKSRTVSFFQKEVVLLLLLMLAVLISALCLILFKYEQRVLFAKLQKLQQKEDSYYIERGKLLLEQSTWATPARLEQIARVKLNMKLLKPNEYVLIKPSVKSD